MNETNITGALRSTLIVGIILSLSSEFRDGNTLQQH